MQVPRECPGVPTKMLLPETQWDDENAFVDNICKLGDMFGRNFEKFKEGGPGMLPQVRACAVAGLDTQLRGVSPHTRAPPVHEVAASRTLCPAMRTSGAGGRNHAGGARRGGPDGSTVTSALSSLSSSPIHRLHVSSVHNTKRQQARSRMERKGT